MPDLDDTLSCPCGSPAAYANCCELIHINPKRAITAEQLMRSRYSAFALGNSHYLYATHHPSKRSPNEKLELEDSINNCQWTALQIIACHRGMAGDHEGSVEFIAKYRENQRQHALHEISRFCYEQDQWFYLDGNQPIAKINYKLGRNDPCWCGSNKKFKKCHG